jgi:GH15 family glucan-1,4-alpha-glucosidase
VYRDGYLPIEDHGLIGDGTTAALVGVDGTISWLCLPRFDSMPVFCSILDRTIGGAFRIDAGTIIDARHRYLGDTAILITELRTSTGIVRITDLMPLRDNADLGMEGTPSTGELLRCVEVVEGTGDITARVEIRGGCDPERGRNGIRLRPRRFPELELELESSRELDGAGGSWHLERGESVTFCLRWNGGVGASSVDAPVAAVANTTEGWLGWLRAFAYRGPQRELVRRSAITIKLLDYLPNGSLIAAPTSSLPEQIGGERNWDYRYVWVRDGSFTVSSLRRIGLEAEANQFLRWTLALCAQGHVNVMYTLDGHTKIEEVLDPELEGYRKSGPVRWGNAASDQVQHDVFGELVDLAYQSTTRGGELGNQLWVQVRELVERAAAAWNKPDQGIWEVRSAGMVQTYSAGICHVALDRGARLASRYGSTADAARWRQGAATIQQAILSDAWSEQGQYLGQGLGGGHLDAAVLGLPIRRVVPAGHPRMIATTEAIASQLGAGDGLLYRYLPERSPDGLKGDEGAFLLCSFWMIDNLVLQGRTEEALEQFDTMCARTNALGLLPEEIDPGTGRFLGNFPQAFSHLGLISSGVGLWRAGVDKDGNLDQS